MKLFAADQYQAKSTAVYEDTRRMLRVVLPKARIEHVGASSIPGADSKGDIDICVVVPHEEMKKTLQVLLDLGYVEKCGTLRTPQLCMLMSDRTDVDLALQVIEEGSEFEFFIVFRDALCANSDLVSRYNQIKRESAHLGEAGYRNAKTRLIQQVLKEYTF